MLPPPPVQNVLETLGDTPLLELVRLRPEGGARLFAKVESMGQTGSADDRVALGRIRDLRSSGALPEGAPLVVASLGDFAISAVMVGRALGHPVHAVIPESASLERQQILRAWGVKRVVSPAEAQLPGAIARARELSAGIPGAVVLLEDEEAAAAVHEASTGVELIRTFQEEGMSVEAFVGGRGPGGLFLGVGRALRSAFPGVKLVPVEPGPGPHHLQGLVVASSSAESAAESVVLVTEVEAERTRVRLGRETGLLVSLFGAANIAGALTLARSLGPNACVVTVIPAGGEREFSLGDSGAKPVHAQQVLIVGLGGLGCPASLALGQEGIGALTLMDADRVELSNLPRQPWHHTRDVGRLKVDSAAEKLRAAFPKLRVDARAERVDADNALELFARHDWVVDATDSVASKFLLSDTSVQTGTPVAHGGVVRLQGQAMVLQRGGPCLRCLFEEVPREDELPTCAGAGVLGSLVGVVGVLQVRLALWELRVRPGAARASSA